MSEVSFRLNGVEVSGSVDGRTLLSGFLRDGLGQTGTHVGCDTSQCGACVVHVNGEAVKSCTMLAVEADGAGFAGKFDGGQFAPGGQLWAAGGGQQQAFMRDHHVGCPGKVAVAIEFAA